MIKEIVQFVDALPAETFTKNLKLREGLYLFLDIDIQNGKYILTNMDNSGRIIKDDFGMWTSKTEPSSFFNKCLEIQINTIPASPQKIFNPDKKIFNLSCSPFALAFVKKNYSNPKYNKDLLKNQLSIQYFKTAEKYLVNTQQRSFFYPFKDFLIENLYDFLNNLPDYQRAKETATINIYCKKAALIDFISTHEAYIKENVFNKSQYNVKFQGKLFGISDSLSGFNEKKRFLQHKTGFTDLNYRVTGENAENLWKFFRLQQNKQLPKPTPIFVDKEELDLNNDLVKFYQDDKILSYSKLIEALLKKHRKQLHNFYLLFFQNGIIDLDFIPVFRYELEKVPTLIEVFDNGEKFKGLNVKTVFDLLYNIFNKVFNNQLIQNRQDGNVWMKFFDDLEPNPKYNFTDTIVNLMYKYRKAIYDYVYKSRHESITCLMFDDLMYTSILDDIRHDESDRKGYSLKEDSIKIKLNIWFNFWDYFTNNQNRINMANRTIEILDRLKAVATSSNDHIQNDEEFAFAAGQLIYKILLQSKSGNRTHALLEPFLQKSEPIEFKKSIARAFDTYKHEFVMYSQKFAFDKLMSEVMGFEPQEKSMKNLIHMILAGYFAESIFKKEREINSEQ